jgi:hypothetical protein
VISSSQRPLPDNTQHSQETDVHAPGGIRTHTLRGRAAADPRLTPRCHWDWPFSFKAMNYDYCINSSVNQEPCCAVTTSTVHVYLYNRSSTRSLLNESSDHVTRGHEFESRSLVVISTRHIQECHLYAYIQSHNCSCVTVMMLIHDSTFSSVTYRTAGARLQEFSVVIMKQTIILSPLGS